VKTSKLKIVPFTAGVDRHCCWFLDLADFLVLHAGRVTYSPNDASWLFPNLQSTQSPASTIGGYIKTLQPQIEGLSSEANAAGTRPGVCNTLASQMPAERVIDVTGHDLKNASALYEYIDARLATCVPGSRVLGGWPAPPWGQLGFSPVPASLEPLAAVGISKTELNDAIDDVFRLDSATPPMLHRNGDLRPAVHAAFATMIMYYNERTRAGEMREVHIKLHTSLRKFGSDIDLPAMIISWGSLIRNQFRSDNIRLTSWQEHESGDQMATAITQLSQTLLSYKASMEQRLHSVENELSSLKALLATFTPMLLLIPQLVSSYRLHTACRRHNFRCPTVPAPAVLVRRAQVRILSQISAGNIARRRP
jgi:hypothetical protein